MQSKLVEEIVKNIKKKSSQSVYVKSSYDVLNYDGEIPSFEKMSYKVVAAKNFVKN